MLELMLDLLDRAARGFLFALPAAIFWFAALCFRKRGRTTQHIGLSLVFLFYLSGVLAVTGIRRPFGFFPRLALVPFVDMLKGPVDTTLNVLLFLPLGVFLPILYAEFDGIRQIALCAFALSLAIELTQMFGFGITDVNDLMTNTAGACLGLFLYRAVWKWKNAEQKTKLQAHSLSRIEVLLLTASVFLSMMVFAPAWLR